MDKLLIPAYAKINLAIDITGKREDGYHYVDMISQALVLHDDIELVKTQEEVKVSCKNTYVPQDKNNIAVKAAEKFFSETGIKGSVSIKIRKRIPVAAGLGGGSADGAAVLKGLRSMYMPSLTDEEIENIGAKIGADVPFFIKGGIARLTGIGEKIQSLPLSSKYYILLVKPNFGVPTKMVYENFRFENVDRRPDIEKLLNAIKNQDLKEMSMHMENVLESVTIKKYNILQEIKNIMLEAKAYTALMTGSGPTVFGIFFNYYQAMKAMNMFYKSNIRNEKLKYIITSPMY